VPAKSITTAKELFAKLVYPSLKDFNWAIHSNLIANYPFTVEKIDNAQQIRGKDVAALNCKTTQNKIEAISGTEMKSKGLSVSAQGSIPAKKASDLKIMENDSACNMRKLMAKKIIRTKNMTGLKLTDTSKVLQKLTIRLKHEKMKNAMRKANPKIKKTMGRTQMTTNS